MLDNNKNSIPFLNNLLQNSNENETNKEDINSISANEEGNPTNTENVINSNNGNDKNESKQNNENSNTENPGLGGGKEDNTQVENSKEDKNKSQMEIDANNIKGTYNLIKPLEGTITSRFGQRDPTTPTVPKNHTGIDIAANTGTDIIAALDGVVELASNEGDYGKHLKIQIGEVSIIYAHCNNLYVKQGEQIKQGQEIAEV